MSGDVAALLQQHLAGATAEDLIASLAGDDPRLTQIAHVLADRENRLSDDLREREREEAEAEQAAAQRMRAERATAALRAEAASLEAGLSRLQETVESLARALGACPACAGDDDACPLCRGRGRPGSLPPDPTAFDEFVLPAVRAQLHYRSRIVREPEQPHQERNPS